MWNSWHSKASWKLIRLHKLQRSFLFLLIASALSSEGIRKTPLILDGLSRKTHVPEPTLERRLRLLPKLSGKADLCQGTSQGSQGPPLQEHRLWQSPWHPCGKAKRLPACPHQCVWKALTATWTLSVPASTGGWAPAWHPGTQPQLDVPLGALLEHQHLHHCSLAQQLSLDFPHPALVCKETHRNQIRSIAMIWEVYRPHLPFTKIPLIILKQRYLKGSREAKDILHIKQK